MLALLMLLGKSHAQLSVPGPCPPRVDDGFGVPCHQTAISNLPFDGELLPPGSFIPQPSKYGCFLECSLEEEFEGEISITEPVPVVGSCDEFTTTVCYHASLFNSPPNLNSMRVRLKYSRTFLIPGDANDNNPAVQVWRFLANGNFQQGNVANCQSMSPPNPSGNSPCPLPPCASQLPGGVEPHFYGFIDLMCHEDTNPATGEISTIWRFLLGMTHEVGCISHANFPTLNAQALPATSGARHDDRSYVMVSPSVSTMPFKFHQPPLPLPSIIVTSGLNGALRSSGTLDFPICVGQSDFMGHNLAAVDQMCPCGAATGDFPYYNQSMTPDCNLTVSPPIFDNCVACAGTVISFSTIPLPFSDTLPTGFQQHFIGEWSPGVIGADGTRLFLNLGLISYFDPCRDPQATIVNQFGFHMTRGVTTEYGNTTKRPTLFGAPGQPLELMTDFADHLGDDPMELSSFGNPFTGVTSRSAIVWKFAR